MEFVLIALEGFVSTFQVFDHIIRSGSMSVQTGLVLSLSTAASWRMFLGVAQCNWKGIGLKYPQSSQMTAAVDGDISMKSPHGQAGILGLVAPKQKLSFSRNTGIPPKSHLCSTFKLVLWDASNSLNPNKIDLGHAPLRSLCSNSTISLIYSSL